MMSLRTQWLEKPQKYDGTQLRSHWIYHSQGIIGDAVVGFRGECDVTLEHMVDQEDIRNQEPIFSHEMLHFIAEFFGRDLENTVLRQHLLICCIKDQLLELGLPDIQRDGDDLYDGDAKLSVSIATVSPISGLIHTALNIRSDETPVKTKGLKDYRINPEQLAQSVLESYRKDIHVIQRSCWKVQWVK